MSSPAHPAPGPPDPREWRPSVSPWLIAASVVLATFMEVLDTTIVVVALPHIAGSMSATDAEATWTLTSYLVSNAIVLPMSGWLALRFGRKRLLIVCTSLFVLSSMLCGLAPSMPVLILARILQGAGGGALQPLAQAVLLESFPPVQRGMAMAMYGLVVVVAPIIGPTVGGWLTDNYSWRWAFYINLPTGLLALLLMARFLEDPPYITHGKAGRLDGVGFGCMALWLATLQVVLDKGQDEDWFSSRWITWFTVVSAAAVVAFVVRELRVRDPFVNLRVFTDRNFWTGTALMTIFAGLLYSSGTLLSLFLQTLLGYTAALAGRAISPRGIASLFGLPLVGFLIRFVDGRKLILVGLSLMAVTNFMLGGLSLEIGMSSVVVANLLQGFGMSFIFVPLLTLSVGRLRNEQMGNATGIYNLMRNLGGSIGISITNTYLVRDAQRHQAMMVAHLTPYDPAYQRHLAALQAGLTPLSGASQAQQQAYGVLHGILLRQANLCAFVDTYRWMAVAALLCIPGAFLMRRVVAKRGMDSH